MDPTTQVNVTALQPCELDESAEWMVQPEFDDASAPLPSGPFDLRTARAAAVALLGRTNCLRATLVPVE